MLGDTDAGAFQLMLDFIYGGPVELNQDNIECVLELSVRFAVGVLIEQCCNFLASAVAVDTACAILIIADVRTWSLFWACPSISQIRRRHHLTHTLTPTSQRQRQKYDCRPLRRDTLLFVVAHLPRCWATAREHFARLPKALLVEVLAHDALVHGEIVAFHAAVFWLEERRRLLAGGGGGGGTGVGVVEEDDEASLVEQVLAHVRFPHMPARLLVEEVESHPIMQREVRVRGAVAWLLASFQDLRGRLSTHFTLHPHGTIEINDWQACKRFVLEAYRYQAVLQRCSSSAAAYHEQQEVLRCVRNESRAPPTSLLRAHASLFT